MVCWLRQEGSIGGRREVIGYHFNCWSSPNYIVKPGNQESLVPWNVANCLLGTKPGNLKVKVPITASRRWKGGVGFVGAATEEAINGGKQVAPPTTGAHCALWLRSQPSSPFLRLRGLALHACVWGGVAAF